MRRGLRGGWRRTATFRGSRCSTSPSTTTRAIGVRSSATNFSARSTKLKISREVREGVQVTGECKDQARASTEIHVISIQETNPIDGTLGILKKERSKTMPGTTCYREERVNEWEGEIKSDAESVSEWEGATKIDAENGVSMRGEEIVEDN